MVHVTAKREKSVQNVLRVKGNMLVYKTNNQDGELAPQSACRDHERGIKIISYQCDETDEEIKSEE